MTYLITTKILAECISERKLLSQEMELNLDSHDKGLMINYLLAQHLNLGHHPGVQAALADAVLVELAKKGKAA